LNFEEGVTAFKNSQSLVHCTRLKHQCHFKFKQRKYEIPNCCFTYHQRPDVSSKSAIDYINQGIDFGSKGQFDQAIADYNKAIEINPKDVTAYHNRAVSYFYKKEYAKAWDDVNKAQNLGYQVHPKFLKALREASGK